MGQSSTVRVPTPTPSAPRRARPSSGSRDPIQQQPTQFEVTPPVRWGVRPGVGQSATAIALTRRALLDVVRAKVATGEMRLRSGGPLVLNELHRQLLAGSDVECSIASWHKICMPDQDGLVQVSDEFVDSILRAIGCDDRTCKAVKSAYRLARVDAKQRKLRGDDRSKHGAGPGRLTSVASFLAYLDDQMGAWDAAPGGSVDYRHPNLSFPDVPVNHLARARQLAADGVLNENQLAYCLFSACKHGAEYRTWLSTCVDEAAAAEAMVDLIFCVQEGWVRPRLRAAWCLSRMNQMLRQRAQTFCDHALATAPPASRELLHASVTRSVEKVVQDRLAADPPFYDPITAGKAMAVLREFEEAFIYPGARRSLR